MDNLHKKPCLVQTSQGFSVSYDNKYLYSKYSPSRLILNTIEKLTVLPGTLFLCCSPVLSYGLNELLEKIENDSFCILCEFDKELAAFENENLKLSSKYKNYAILSANELERLPLLINQISYTSENQQKIDFAGRFKRVVRIDFSAGVQFHSDLYDELTACCTNAIMTFWANRITLSKFGRKYSQNLFRNLKILPETIPIENFIGKISKPIVVFGAGESTDTGIKEIKKLSDKPFILCADTALQPLIKNNIFPDGVFVEEAQNIIKKAFIGIQNTPVHIFAGLSSVSRLNGIVPNNRLSFFTTLYAQTDFFDNLQKTNLLPFANQPFGSVGLTTVYYACLFRCSEEIPVYIYGLDFSYSAGKTHAKGTLAHITRLLSASKLNSIENFSASFNTTAIKCVDKKNVEVFSSRNLRNYATLFNGLFCNKKNLFDAADSGLKLNIPARKPVESDFTISSENYSAQVIPYSPSFKEKMKHFFKEEHNALCELRDILSGAKKLPQCQLENEIIKIASHREYLFLHFPDGWQFKTEISFLKRIRTEIDFFLKYITLPDL